MEGHNLFTMALSYIFIGLAIQVSSTNAKNKLKKEIKNLIISIHLFESS